MKKFTSLLMGCALALAGAALAQQQPDEQASPATPKGKHAPKTEATSEATTAKPEGGAGKQHGAKAERGAAKNAPKTEGTTTDATTGATTTAKPEGGAGKHHGAKNERGTSTNPNSAATSADTGASPSTGAAATAAPNAKHQGGHGKNARGANATTAASATPATAASASATPVTAAASATPAATATAAATTPATTTASAAPTVAAAGETNVNGRVRGAGKKPDVQVVQQIKQQHMSFKAQARPDKVPAVTFNQSYRIQGSDRWQGQQYEVFRSYHPERHDEGFYRSHYPRVELIGGGYYYMNNGYWYPAWGYSRTAEYYPYDGPIYVGHRTQPPDQVIADVQAALQQMGYYKGEVDGLLGPLTREALTAYQSEEGLATTAAIDEPTLDALGLES